MRTLLDEHFAPTTSSFGFLELPLDKAAEALEEWDRSIKDGVRVSRPEEGFPEVLHRLEPLIGGSRRRELLVSAGKWTAYFDNLLRGTDADSAIGYLSEALQCHGLAITSVPHTIGLPGIREGRPGAVQFTLFGPLPTHFLNYVRSIEAVYDGRWIFDANGTAQPFEETEVYKSRRVRDRFTSEMLERYCKALGVDVFNPDAYGPDAFLIENDEDISPDAYVMTLAEVQEWLEIKPGMARDIPG